MMPVKKTSHPAPTQSTPIEIIVKSLTYRHTRRIINPSMRQRRRSAAVRTDGGRRYRVSVPPMREQNWQPLILKYTG
jgi:hypothetical protein